MLKVICGKKTFLYSFLLTFIFGFVAHGYCYFNLSYSHDSLLIYQNDTAWQISIGRFLHPIYFLLRGNIYSPYLVGLLSLVFISVAVYLISKLLNFNNLISICFISAVLTTNSTITLLNATYIHDTDIYALSLLFAVSAVYFLRNFKFGFFLSIPFIVISLGLYQSFLQVSVFLLMLLALLDLLNNNKPLSVIIFGIKSVVSVFASLLCYSFILKLVLKFTKITMADSYNGLSNIGNFGGLSRIIKLFFETYSAFFDKVANPDIYNQGLFCVINFILIAISVISILFIILKRKIKAPSIALICLIIALMPFGINLIYFISLGLEHDLMIYSFFFAYVLFYKLFEMSFECKNEGKKHNLPSDNKLFSSVILVFVGVFVLSSTIYSNQIYLRKDFEYQSTQQMANRIIMRLEDIDGYEMGKTKVAFIGRFYLSDLAIVREGFENSGTGLERGLSLTNYSKYSNYFKYVMNYPLNLVPEKDADELSKKQEIKEMPTYPANGSCKMVDDIIVVKLSEVS